MASKKSEQPKKLEQAPVQPIENKKEKKKMKKFNWETIKTVIIAVLITGIVTFISGMRYQEANTVKIHDEAKSLVNAASLATQEKK